VRHRRVRSRRSARGHGYSAGRWRRPHHGVSDIIATILLVAITVVLAAVLYILISGLTKAPGSTPIGSAFSLGTISEATSGSGAAQRWYYNATVQTASGGMTWSNMVFQVKSPAGSVVTAGPLAITTTNAALSCTVATYTFSSASWSPPSANACSGSVVGASGQPVPGSQLQLTSTASLQYQDDSLVAIGQGTFSGSAGFTIP
jgi:flagellin-like protein